MGAVIEIKYFNTFILKKTNSDNDPIWNGSFGVPETVPGSYPVVSSVTGTNNYAIEESRIRGGYNNTTVDFGVKAYIVEDERLGSYRSSSLIYSGIFNSRTGINQTNVFSVGEDISKTADPANGSIQKLYAEDTNLSIFQELKVSRALIDKDAIYSAEGGGSVTSSNLVIGVIQPYAGEYGISKNPESFAVYGYSKYFSDLNKNCILRLSQNGIEEISRYGMRDFFRDDVNRINSSAGKGMILGGYDIHNNQYVTSLQEDFTNRGSSATYNTLSFDEQAKGWVSFFSYEPEQMFSIKNDFYTVKQGGIWEQYADPIVYPSAKRSNFYGVDYSSSVTVSFNAAPANSKTFKTVSYEGSNGWGLTSLISDPTGANTMPNASTFSFSNDLTNLETPSTIFPSLYSYYEGEYIQLRSTGTIATITSNTNFLISSNKRPILNAVVSGQGIPVNTTLTLTLPVVGEVGATNNNTTNTTLNPPILHNIPVGTIITPGPNVDPFETNTSVVSYNIATGLLVTNQPINVLLGANILFDNLYEINISNAAVAPALSTILTFDSVTNRADYVSVFASEIPPYPAEHAGFDRKENKYVANLRNFTPASNGEVIWGDSISGVKGFYALGTFSTDTITDLGSEKQLFSVESSYTINNGY